MIAQEIVNARKAITRNEYEWVQSIEPTKRLFKKQLFDLQVECNHSPDGPYRGDTLVSETNCSDYHECDICLKRWYASDD